MRVEPQVLSRGEIRLLGMSRRTSLRQNETFALWKEFKTHLAKLDLQLNGEFYSVQVYDGGLDLNTFGPETQFTKWAAYASEEHSIPQGMEELIIPSGRYLTFSHRGTVMDFSALMQELYTSWLPGTEYQLDSRPHFEVLGEEYLGPMDPRSVEEVWIPIK